MKINNINSYLYKAKETFTKKTNKDAPEKQIQKDAFDSLTYKNGSIDFNHLTNLTLESLKNTYKNINIFVGSLENKNTLKEYAMLTNGKNLIISSEFIEKMKSDPESYDKGKVILEEILNQLSSLQLDLKSIGAYVNEKGVTYWSSYEMPKEDTSEIDRLLDHMKRMQEKMDSIKENFKVKISNSMYNSPAEVYGKLAQTSTIPEVKSVVSMAEHKIYVLKSALSTCEKHERNKIKAAIAQLEKAVARAGGKVKDLIKEDNMKVDHKKAKMQNEERKAEKIKIELERQKAMRKSRETAQINEGRQISYYPEELIGNKNLEYFDENLDVYYQDIDIDNSSDIGSVEVNISETIEISL